MFFRRATTGNQLRKYQKTGVDFLKRREAALLGDEPGLGKTAQTLAALAQTSDKRILVLCPKFVMSVWAREAAMWDADAAVRLLAGSGPQKRQTLIDTFNLERGRRTYYITNWETLLQDNVPLQAVKWDCVVGDEIHKIKNRAAKTTKALKKLKARRKIGLSGTPFVNKAEELWSILNWLAPRRWHSYWQFYETYLEYTETPWGKQSTELRSNGLPLQMDIKPWVLRRLKSEVLTELPAKQHQHVWTEMSHTQYQMYMRLKKDFLAEHKDTRVDTPGVLARLTRFRQCVVSPAVIDPSFPDDSPRLDAIAEYIVDLEQPVIVFSNYKASLRLLAKRLPKTCKTFMMTGDTKKAENEKTIQNFQKAQGSAAFLATIDAAGVGITLNNASTVIFIDRSYSPGKNLQAEDRAHRIGQKNAVNIVIFGIPQTIDEQIEFILAKKAGEFSKVLASDMIGTPKKPGKMVIV